MTKALDNAKYITLALLFFVASAFSLLLVTMPAGASEIKIEKVSPVLECVRQLGENSYRSYWGYNNKNNFAVEQEIGSKNKMTGGGLTGQDQGQPTEFKPGRVVNAFSVDFDGTNLVWTMNIGSGSTATASSNPKQACPSYFQFDKVWEGDSFDASKVSVEFTADGDFSWTLGEDSPVKVVPGETTLTNVKEVVTGLPEGCSYESNLPSEIKAPETGYDEDGLFTLTVTNTVECEDEGEVLADVDEKPVQVTQTPTGSVNAGGAGHIAIAGLLASIAFATFGAVTRKISRN